MKPTKWQCYKAFRYYLIHKRKWKCEVCRRSRNILHIHHNDFGPNGGGELIPERNTIKSCLVLCPSCHTKIHIKHREQSQHSKG